MSKKAKVLYGDQLAGRLSETYEGYSFEYNADYINAGGKPVSLTLPLTTGTYASKVLS